MTAANRLTLVFLFFCLQGFAQAVPPPASSPAPAPAPPIEFTASGAIKSLTVGGLTYEEVVLTEFKNKTVGFSHSIGIKNLPLTVFTRPQIDALNQSSPKVSINPGSVDLTPVTAEESAEAERLIKQAGDVDALLANGNTPLIDAASRGSLGVVRSLIAREASVNLKSVSGKTALGEAAANRHYKVAELLSDSGAKPADFWTAVDVGDLDAMGQWLRNDKNILKSSDPDGMTPLLRAVAAGQKQSADLLVSRGSDVNDTNKKTGQTPLMIASANGDLNLLKYLLQKRASLDVQDQSGRTALMVAASSGQTDVVRQLLESHADWKKAAPSGDTALTLAKAGGHAEATALLEAVAAPPAPPKPTATAASTATASAEGNPVQQSVEDARKKAAAYRTEAEALKAKNPNDKKIQILLARASAEEARAKAAEKRLQAEAAKKSTPANSTIAPTSKAAASEKPVYTPKKSATSKTSSPATKTSSSSSAVPELPGFIIAFFVLGILAYIVGNFWMMFLAWKESPLWGLGIFFFNPITNLIFFFMHMRDTWIPFCVMIFGCLLIFVPPIIYGIVQAM